jgi:hypothetical protein
MQSTIETQVADDDAPGFAARSSGRYSRGRCHEGSATPHGAGSKR